MTDILTREALAGLPFPSLLTQAENLGIEESKALTKQKLLLKVMQGYANQNKAISATGVLSVHQDGFGYLRSSSAHFLPRSDDIYVSPQLIKEHGLRTGDTLSGLLTPPEEGMRYFSIHKLLSVNDLSTDQISHRKRFDDLTPLYPDTRIQLEMSDTGEKNKKDYSLRTIDLVAPLGFGQRALIVAPPRTGKTVMMQNIAHALMKNHPNTFLIVLMVGERPEEVTDMSCSVSG